MADYDKVIPPGQSGKILATLNTKKYRGRLNKSIVVSTNDPSQEKVTLYMRCSVLGVKILPVARAYFYKMLGESQTKELEIATIGEGPITIYTRPSNPNIVVKLEKLVNAPKPVNESEYWKQYKLSITIPENFPEGRFSENVTLVTDSEYHSTIKISAEGEVTPTVVVSPSSVRMRTAQGGNFAEKSIKVTRKSGNGFKISNVITDPKTLKSQLSETQEGKQYSLALTWTDVTSKGQYNGRIIIHTNDKLKSIISVPVHVTIE